MGRCLKERLQKEDKGGHIVLESIIFSVRYKAGPQGALLNRLGGANGRSSTKVALPHNENLAGRRRERKSSRPPETTVPVLDVLPENKNLAGRRRRPFQYLMNY